jgi:hypothetical protein
MQIHSSLLLLATFGFIYAPALSRWLNDASPLWYRHYLVWLVIIIFIFISHYKQHRNDP